MTRPFLPTDSKSFFVGRERELKQITGILETGRPPKWLIQILGDGGIGKTRLLESLRHLRRENSRRRKWLCTDLIDFFRTSNRTISGLLTEIARQLGPERFPEFEIQLQNFHEVLNRYPDANLYQDAVRRVSVAFFDDWRRLLKDGAHVLLLFDTCEEMHDLTSWIMRTMLPEFLKIQKEIQLENESGAAEPSELSFQTVTVWAGRDALPFPEELDQYVLPLTLSPLSLAEVKEFFRQAQWFPGKVKLKELEQLNARCGGRPLYIALSYDWLKNGAGLIDELLGVRPPFEEKLLNWLSGLSDLQNNAIRSAAFAWRRMEPELSAQLLDISIGEARNLLEALGRFSFAKYCPPAKDFPGSFQLHDEMRDLVKRRFWVHESDLTTKNRLDEIIAWYKSRIGNAILERKELPRTDEMRALTAEYIYYECERDPRTGSRIAEELFKHNIHFVNLPFCELLNDEISRFEGALSNDRIDQLRFQQALVAFRKEGYNWASQFWHSLIRRPDADLKLQATSRMMLVELGCFIGEHREALENAEAAENIYNRLLQNPELDDETRKLVSKELGQLYHNRGYVCRVQGKLQEALNYYEKALQQGDTEKNNARCLNNIGYVYFLEGDTEKAVTYVGKALHIRQKLGIAYESGLGSNTMGMIMESMGRISEASELYYKARNYFEAAGSDRGLALVQINLGRLMRMTNALDQALEHLTAAVKAFRDKGETDYLIKALNELGCAYRQQATAEARPAAAEHLKESLRLSRSLELPPETADNLDDLQILFYQWSLDLRKQGRGEQADDYLEQAKAFGREARRIAEAHDLKTILANVERTNGDMDFELQDYKKAFQKYFNAGQLLARAGIEKGRVPQQIQQRLTENTNRIQKRLHTLSAAQEEEYASMILSWMDVLPEEIKTQLKSLRNILLETLQLSRGLLPSFEGDSQTRI